MKHRRRHQQRSYPSGGILPPALMKAWPISFYEIIAEHKLPAVFHCDHCGIGAGMPQDVVRFEFSADGPRSLDRRCSSLPKRWKAKRLPPSSSISCATVPRPKGLALLRLDGWVTNCAPGIERG